MNYLEEFSKKIIKVQISFDVRWKVTINLIYNLS